MSAAGDLTSNQIGGYKATISNPHTSEEAKDRARDKLDLGREHEEGGDGEYVEDTEDTTTSGATGDDKPTNRVLGGYKATLKNPNTSDKAKAHAEEVLHQEGAI